MSDLPSAADHAIDCLSARLDDLEQRVSLLEHPESAQAQKTARKADATPQASGAPTAAVAGGGAFAVFGRAMLGIAGAYLLRAVAASSLAPPMLVAAVAIAYAILWLAGAARTSAWFPRAIYACTSALILAPMLWELTLRFQVLPAAAAAGALAAFIAVAFSLAWKRQRIPVLWIANLTVAGLAVTLALAAHTVAPFLILLLLTAVVAELHAESGSERGVRILMAGAADAAVWMEIYLYSGPQATRPEYPVLSTAALVTPGIVLFLIYASGVLVRTIARGREITTFETLQATMAFLLAACSLLLFAPATGAVVLRTACFALAAGLYAATFVLFDRSPAQRNYTVFATWSAALLLAGLWMCLEGPWLAGALSAAALAATIAGARFHRLALEFHGAAYLLAAVFAAELLSFLAHAFTGPLPTAPSFSVDLAAACAVLCYAVSKSRPDEPRKPQMLHLLFALLAVGSTAAMLVEGSVRLLALGIQPGAHHLAFIRTLVLCALALALAFAGAQAHKLELTRIGYAALALVAVKLVAEDLRLGHFEYIAASIFLFALTLIAAPRVARGTASFKRKSLL